MGNETNTDETVVDENIKDGAEVETPETTDKDKSTDTDKPFSITEEDYNKAIQSAEDKVRGKLSKEIKTLKEEISKLKPVEKSDAEKALEVRIAALEASEKEVADQKRKLDIQKTLSAKGIDETLVDFLKDDADIESLSAIIDTMIKASAKSNGFVPGEHDSDEEISVEEFNKMTYSQKVKVKESKPELYKRLMAKRK